MTSRHFKFELLIIGTLLTALFLINSPSHPEAQNTSPIFSCDLSQIISISTATTTRIIQNDNVSDNPSRIRTCSVNITVVGGATANSITAFYGTGATCGTGSTNLAGWISDNVAGTVKPITMLYPWKPIPVGNNFCITTTQALNVIGVISYALF